MCEPTTIALVASAAIGLGTAVYSADMQKKQGEANAQIAENNARLSRDQADATNAAAAREMEQQAWRTRAIIGQQRASIAANNLDPTMGTPAELLGESAMFGEIDQQTIRSNAAREAWGFRAQETNFTNEAMLSRWGGRAQARGTILAGIGNAAGSMAGAWGGGASSSAARTAGRSANAYGGFRGLGGWGY